MNRTQILFLLFVFLVFSPLIAFSQEGGLKVTREPVVVFPSLNADSVVGIRLSGTQGILALRNGAIIRVNLETGETTSGTPFTEEIADFALMNGQPLGLSRSGRLMGATSAQWPKDGFPACRLETGEGEALLTGGPRSFYLPANATMPAVIPHYLLALPLKDGIMWAVRHHPETRIWQAELADMFGNRMKRLYRFSREFSPTGVTIGQLGPDGELLLSYFAGRNRELVLLGQNGRMLWKLTAPTPACPRDLAWDQKGNLLILEKADQGLVLNRWKFDLPEG